MAFLVSLSIKVFAVKTSSAKAKGRALQNLVRDKLLSLFPELEPDDAKSCSMGNNGEDVQLSPAARRLAPISIECKNRAAMAVYKDFKQAVSNAKALNPVLVIKQNRDTPLVVINLEYFLTLLKNSAILSKWQKDENVTR